MKGLPPVVRRLLPLTGIAGATLILILAATAAELGPAQSSSTAADPSAGPAPASALAPAAASATAAGAAGSETGYTASDAENAKESLRSSSTEAEPVSQHALEARPLPARLPGADEVRAVASAYPDRVESVGMRSGQWALRIDGEWFYWEDGRLLREDLRDRRDEFSPLRFYNYYRGPLRIRDVAPEQEERLRNILAEREADPPTRHPAFQDALYGVSSRAEAEARMQKVRFLGLTTRLNPLVAEPLARVQAEIREVARTDPEVASFIASLGRLAGYHWRNIAGTRARSFHGYGVAVDLVPRSYEGTYGYWRWAAEAGIEDWWRLGEERRFSVPQPVVDAFERHGFVWGGKWLFFDPIHFEYRPEVFLLDEEG